MEEPPTTTAFVLSGGASLGAIQVGMLEALSERGITPDLIVGTSVGALNGAFIASRPPTMETIHELSSIWRACVAPPSSRSIHSPVCWGSWAPALALCRTRAFAA